MDFVTPKIAVGSRRVLVWTLKRNKITHVINVCEKPDRPSVIEHFGYLHNPCADDGMPKRPEYWHKTTEFALEALKHHDTRLYVHCSAGMHRGPASVVAILVAAGYNQEVAWGTVRATRKQAYRRYL